MPEQDRRAAQKAERAKGLHDAMADAAAWFSEQLGGLSGGDARELLNRRGSRRRRPAPSAWASRPIAGAS